MAFSWKASFFAIILLSSISILNLTFAQSYNNSSNITPNHSSVVCGYDLWGNLYLSEHGKADLCNSKGTPTLLSQSKGKLSTEGIQNLVNRDRQLYGFMWLHSTNVRYSDLDISTMCKYDKNGNFAASLSDIQKEVLADLKNNYRVFICPFTGTPTHPLPTSIVPAEPAKLVGVTPAPPKCQEGQTMYANVCLSLETTCPSGFEVLNGNMCIFLEPLCPSNSISGNGDCTLNQPICNAELCVEQTPILFCSLGTELDGKCVLTSQIQPTPQLTCPEGYGFQNNSNFCVVSSTLQRQTCPLGTILENDMCIAPKNTESDTKSLSNETSIQKTSHASQKLGLPSLKQIKSGMIQDVKCKEGYVPAIKTGNGHPVCLKPQTAEKLVKRELVHYSK